MVQKPRIAYNVGGRIGILLSLLLLTACSALLFPTYSRVAGGDP
jgi:hypothetical protein